MASPFEPLPQLKRLRTVSFDKAIEKDTILDLEVYHSDDDLDYVEDDVDSSSEISSLEDVDIDTDVSDGGSSVSLDVSVADDPAILISRDGTKWYEDRFLVSPPLAETFIENHVPTVTTLGQEAKTLSEIFKLFLNDELSTFILNMTNQKLDSFVTSNPSFGNQKYFKRISLDELHAFFGLMVETGVFRLFREPLDNLYCEDRNKSRPIFNATMPRDRFKVILRFLRFDDETTRSVRQKTDALAPIRYVIDTINENLRAIYLPNKWVTIDEHLCRYRGRCFFKQYIPSKPDRYGIKIYVLADSLNYYPLNFEIYCGKQAVSNKPEDLVLRLCSVLRSGHILCGDNYFTSLSLSNKLLELYNIHYLGTLRKNRREVPKSANDNKGLPIHSSRFFLTSDNKNSLLSYITKKNNHVLLLSNIHFTKQIPDDAKKSRPTIILDYNSHKYAVDKFDQMLKEYRIYRANRRWPVVVFFDMLGFVSHATWVIFCLRYPEDVLVKTKDRREFLYRLGKELIYPLIQTRVASPAYSSFTHKLKRDIAVSMLEASYPIERSTTSENVINEVQPLIVDKMVFKRRCYICPRSKDRKYRTTCHLCKLNICTAHSTRYFVCNYCLEDTC